ncbi:MAG: uracil-DNA glycosylase [Spirochaetes bacterium]|nr:uracil-DNA glycosylase [Spirochaetota bacterium]
MENRQSKSQFAKDFYQFLNYYQDYIEYQHKKTHTTPDFSFYDKKPETISIKPPAITPELKKATKPTDQTWQVKQSQMIELAQNILKCQQCQLGAQAVQKVPGAGNLNSSVLVISYPVTQEEEKKGLPFIGNSGEFFSKWMNAIDIQMSDLFITNILKCCPRKAAVQKEFIEQCRKHLDHQIKIVQPNVILSLGQLTLSALMSKFTDLNLYHGNLFEYQNIPVLPTFHPVDVLTNPHLKKSVWDDLKNLKQLLSTLNTI